jgi:hypothetical protein
MYDDGNRPVKNMTGHALARNGYTKSQRAALAAGVACGEIELTKPTLKQLAKLFNVSVSYIGAALALSPMQRAMMRGGCTEIADIPPSKAALKRTIARAGVEPTWNAICEQL